MCAITKATDPCEAAHIIPFSFGCQPQWGISMFWKALRCFWTQDQVEKWRQFLEENPAEAVRNMVLLAPSVHRYWDRQLFALEPMHMSDDKTTLHLKFHWLCPRPPVISFPPDGPVSYQPPEMPGNLEFGGRTTKYALKPNLRLYNCETDCRISSGDVITLCTDDPDLLPLPEIELFRLQWLLHRITSLAAAAGYLEDDEDYDDFAFEPAALEDECSKLFPPSRFFMGTDDSSSYYL
ncbi:uncharacterized protein GIQ15_00275 [Arthroderma uncinatum]|uniref:uncharacterized protein n=1 Tax=Arthroderma uncinatum TaxID=74035 RepID=UPI00144AAA8A|nr:uncharacterized protein GIQ15_00275 [Arthroderma uncinatum]KAF3490758.1 hypothetical protein GIQ15_00275 [Arthroderma uncinatum]